MQKTDQAASMEERKTQAKTMMQQSIDASTGHELKFWKAYSEGSEVGASQLTRIACEYLSMQATSASPERAFSRSGLVIRKHRNRLGDETGC